MIMSPQYATLKNKISYNRTKLNSKFIHISIIKHIFFFFFDSCELRTSFDQCIYHAMVSDTLFYLSTKRSGFKSVGFNSTRREWSPTPYRFGYLERPWRVSIQIHGPQDQSGIFVHLGEVEVKNLLWFFVK